MDPRTTPVRWAGGICGGDIFTLPLLSVTTYSRTSSQGFRVFGGIRVIYSCKSSGKTTWLTVQGVTLPEDTADFRIEGV